jgi:hypothetical protein
MLMIETALHLSKFVASALPDEHLREELAPHWHGMLRTLLLDDYIYKCDISALMSQQVVDALLNLEFELKDMGILYS